MISVKHDICIKPFNTFRVGARARYFVAISRPSDLKQLFEAGKLFQKKLVLSHGSNVLFTKDFDGLVLHNEMWGMQVVEENDQHILLKVNAGESWPVLVEYTVEKGWGGLENLTLIPGKVGAAPVQNIGAYGVEVKDLIVQVEAFDMTTGELVSFSNEQCEFAYRSSIFKTKHKERYFITSVLFKLDKNPRLNLTYGPLKKAFNGKKSVSVGEVSAEVARIRNSKLPDPEILANAGSFFKNPVVETALAKKILAEFPDAPNYPQPDGTVKLAAGWLIEKCHLKGFRKGDVGVHKDQALVLINYGEATGGQILAFAKMVIERVNQKFGIELVPEVNIY